jgi:superfamily II DNA or RNA helicase
MIKAFSEVFTPEVRDEAQRLFASGRVEVLAIEDTFLTTSVKDVTTERVVIKRRADRFQISCTCPDGKSGACSHVLASMLAARGQGFGQTEKAGPRPVDEESPSKAEEVVPRRTHVVIEGLNAAKILQGVDAFDEIDEDESGRLPSVDWRFRLATLKSQGTPATSRESDTAAEDAPPTEILYAIDAAASASADGALVLIIGHREMKRDREWGRIKYARPWRGLASDLQNPADRRILVMLSGADRDADLASSFRLHDVHRVAARYRVAPEIQWLALSLMAETGRLVLRHPPEKEEAASFLGMDDGSPFALRLQVGATVASFALSGELVRGDERVRMPEIDLVTRGGIVIFRNTVARLEPAEHFSWVDDLVRRGAIEAPRRHQDRLLREIAELPNGMEIDLPEDLGIDRVMGTPTPLVRLKRLPRQGDEADVPLELLFEYGGELIEARSQRKGVLDHTGKRIITRNEPIERDLRAKLLDLGVSVSRDGKGFFVESADVAALLPRLGDEGFRVLLRERELKRDLGLRFRVSSGVDWFDLKGGLDFGHEVVPWPALLKALRRGETVLTLADGSQGLIPERLVSRYGRLVRLGEEEEDGIRFAKSQVALLEAILAGETDVELDSAFKTAREALKNFERIEARVEPESFKGTLRPYQREGLGWMHFLQEFGFGGCLADDMGLGKTIQVLSLLEDRRLKRLAGEKIAPSLVVVPRSLVFNWKQEAARFTPELKVKDHTSALRSHGSFDEWDVVLSTYGTLRSDVMRWQGTTFDYAILDEAQAIKNATTESARAARLIRSKHRLALSGTPVENRMSELISIFSFLNPSLAAGSVALAELASDKATGPEREILARGLRPYVLRRRKEDVLPDLPPKFEETLYCELGIEQRKLYEEMKEHYRFRITALLETQGLSKSRIQVLEALLRLRQVACSPGLVDDKRKDFRDAKIEALLPRLQEVAAEGHKALVFSQFTSYLALLRPRVEALGLNHVYLDGGTRDRKTVVDQFEADPKTSLFLISLKAGGLGLNLTAADYVFILDPWWNPAVEMQAIARAHRIGQTKPVFAYRMVAKDTVEEKVLELQEKKRELVETLLGEDKGSIASLKREDIELLLS